MTAHLESVGLGGGTAATFTSGFWVALVAGRLLITLVPSSVPEPRIVRAGAAVATVALLAASYGPLAPWAYVVTGLAIAPIFPTGIAWLARLRPGDARATSWLFPAAMVGGIVGPGAIGLVIANSSLAAAPLVLGAVAAGTLVAFVLASRRSSRDL
jgi:fucose permease